MMNDEFYDNHENIREAWYQQLSQDDSYRSGLRFARRIRLARIVGLAALFVPLASVLVSQLLSGVWWLLLVGWVFVWPHLAWQLAFRSTCPHSGEIVNLKIDAIIAGVWMGLIGFNALPTAALIVMIGMNMMGSGGCRLFLTGLALLALSALLTVQSTGTPVLLTSEPLALWLTLPVLVVYPMLFAWLSHRTAIRLAEHKRRLELMSTRDGMTGVFNRRHWETLLRNEFEACRRSHRQATILLIDIDHFKTINDTWGHDVGDEAIVAITRQLQLTLRAGDYIGRFGGDEFAVLFADTDEPGAWIAMQYLVEQTEKYNARQLHPWSLQFSWGLSEFDHHRNDMQAWLKQADAQMYAMKRQHHGEK